MNKFLTVLILLFSINTYAAFPTPISQQTVNDIGDLRNGDIVSITGMSNVTQMVPYINPPSGVTVVNSANGGVVTADFARCKETALNGKPAWSAVPSNTNILIVNLANRGAQVTLAEYKSKLRGNAISVLNCAEGRLNSLRQVWFLSMHGEPFASGTKQDHDVAYVSGELAFELAGIGGYSFDVLIGPYAWANSTPRGDGLVWTLADTADDRVHQTLEGKKKWAAEVSIYMAAAKNGTPPPPTDAQCEPIPPQTQCRLEDNDTICHCRFPDTWDLIGSEPPPPPPPPTGEVCPATTDIPGQTCSIKTRSGGKQYCICQNPWSRTEL